MINKISISEALQFYDDNGLNEVISDKSQNYFIQKEVEKVVEKKEISFVKPVFSTSDALSALAKKTQNNSENIDMAKVVNQQNQENKEAFISLNEIVAKAKKMAAAAKNLAELRVAVESFDGCNLKKMATNTVFCDGNPNSKVMVIGEAPGNHEDLQGIPFCGDSGKVLDAMFKAINMTREKNFYITNVIFWRPPGNRRPTEEELAICRPFVERHIELINPEVIVLVGATSMSAILGMNDPISSIRGKFMDFSPKFLSRTIKTFAIFHPSYLMRQSAKKKLAWFDMLALEQFLKNF
ncbi:MAG: uracil-DNA glycosylase [Rickettsiales bacterium]|nr:uracil-DNA glycosylase [Rickettsiales bacterium]